MTAATTTAHTIDDGIHRARDLRRAGYSRAAAAAQLNGERYPTPHGGPIWHNRDVRHAEESARGHG